MREVKKFQEFCLRDMESCHLVAARRVKLWSLNANLLFEEPKQLTKFALNHIWERTFPFKALIAIFWTTVVLLANEVRSTIMDKSVGTFEQNKHFLSAFFRNFKKHPFCQ